MLNYAASPSYNQVVINDAREKSRLPVIFFLEDFPYGRFPYGRWGLGALGCQLVGPPRLLTFWLDMCVFPIQRPPLSFVQLLNGAHAFWGALCLTPISDTFWMDGYSCEITETHFLRHVLCFWPDDLQLPFNSSTWVADFALDLPLQICRLLSDRNPQILWRLGEACDCFPPTSQDLTFWKSHFHALLSWCHSLRK